MTAAETLMGLRNALGTVAAEDGGASARLARALEAIGWRGGDAMEPAEVAQEILPAIVACAREHGDVGMLYRQTAEVLRSSGPLLDGGLPPVHDYMPAAAEVVRRFIAGAN